MNDIERKSIELAAQSGEAYPVDFDQAWQWIGYARKDYAVDALRRSFVEGRDFSGERRKSTGGRPSEEIRLTKDCFKQFCMLARTEKGRQVRQYFIQCEEKLQSLAAHAVPANDELYLAQALMAADRIIQRHRAEIAEMRSVVAAHEVLTSATGGKTLREYAKIVRSIDGEPVGPLTIFPALEKLKYIYRNSAGYWTPYQRWIEQGLFILRDKPRTRSSGTVIDIVTLITPKGESHIARHHVIITEHPLFDGGLAGK